jgi:hypothetical protein
VVAAAAVTVVGAVADAKLAETDLQPLATAVGEAWATELVRSLRSDDREVIGSWPGTLREARMRIRVAVPMRLDPKLLEELARLANLAARRGWLQVSEADPEP